MGMTPEAQAMYALDFGVDRADLGPLAQDEYDRLAAGGYVEEKRRRQQEREVLAADRRLRNAQPPLPWFVVYYGGLFLLMLAWVAGTGAWWLARDGAIHWRVTLIGLAVVLGLMLLMLAVRWSNAAELRRARTRPRGRVPAEPPRTDLREVSGGIRRVPAAAEVRRVEAELARLKAEILRGDQAGGSRRPDKGEWWQV